jgi:hypothetical protein
MPANKMNYLVVWKGLSQTYGTSSKEVALSSPPPKGFTLDDKFIFFVSWEPDSQCMVTRPIDKEEIMNAELVFPKSRKKDDVQDQETVL